MPKLKKLLHHPSHTSSAAPTLHTLRLRSFLLNITSSRCLIGISATLMSCITWDGISKVDNYDLKAWTIGKYLLKVAVLKWRFLTMLPSLVVAALIWLARLILGHDKWVSVTIQLFILSNLWLDSILSYRSVQPYLIYLSLDPYLMLYTLPPLMSFRVALAPLWHR